MRKNRPSPLRRRWHESQSRTHDGRKPPVLVALIGLIGVIAAALIGFLGVRFQVERPIEATQTAESFYVQTTPDVAYETIQLTKGPSRDGESTRMFAAQLVVDIRQLLVARREGSYLVQISALNSSPDAALITGITISTSPQRTSGGGCGAYSGYRIDNIIELSTELSDTDPIYFAPGPEYASETVFFYPVAGSLFQTCDSYWLSLELATAFELMPDKYGSITVKIPHQFITYDPRDRSPLSTSIPFLDARTAVCVALTIDALGSPIIVAKGVTYEPDGDQPGQLQPCTI